MSSRANVQLLVDHIEQQPKHFSLDLEQEYLFDYDIPGYASDIDQDDVYLFFDSSLKYSVQYGGDPRRAAPPKISEHVPESFFSFEMSTDDLKAFSRVSNFLGNGAPPALLEAEIEKKFVAKISIFAGILDLFGDVELTEPLLYNILPFLWGDKVSSEILKETVVKVGKLLNKGRNGNVKEQSEVLELKAENETKQGEIERLQKQVEEQQATIEALKAKGSGSDVRNAKRGRR